MADSKIPEKEDQASIEVNEKKRKELEAKLEKVGIKAPGYVHGMLNTLRDEGIDMCFLE